MDYLFYSPESKLYGLTIFVSVVFFQMALIAWQWFYERRADYLYYLAYMFSTVCYGLSEFEHFLPFKIFTILTPDFKYYGSHFIPMVSVFLYYRFARAFLILPQTRPKLNAIVIKLEYFVLFLAVSCLLIRFAGIDRIIEEYYFLTGTIIILIVSTIIIANFLTNSTPLSRFAMLGAGCLLFGSAITFTLLIFEQNGIKAYFDPYLPLLIFVIAELLVFSTGLTFKSRLLEKEKLDAEQALIKEFKHRQLLELQMFKVRENISRDLHDELGSGLSKIALLGEVIKKENHHDEPRIDKIIDAAKEMMQGMSEMVWSMNSKNDKLSDFIYYLRRYTTEFFEHSEILAELEIIDHIPDIQVSGLQRRNMLMVYKEILNNVLKHSKATKVKIECHYQNSVFRVDVHDNGIGILAAPYRRSGNGLLNMQSRMSEINGTCTISNRQGAVVQIEMALN